MCTRLSLCVYIIRATGMLRPDTPGDSVLHTSCPLGSLGSWNSGSSSKGSLVSFSSSRSLDPREKTSARRIFRSHFRSQSQFLCFPIFHMRTSQLYQRGEQKFVIFSEKQHFFSFELREIFEHRLAFKKTMVRCFFLDILNIWKISRWPSDFFDSFVAELILGIRNSWGNLKNFFSNKYFEFFVSIFGLFHIARENIWCSHYSLNFLLFKTLLIS